MSFISGANARSSLKSEIIKSSINLYNVEISLKNSYFQIFGKCESVHLSLLHAAEERKKGKIGKGLIELNFERTD